MNGIPLLQQAASGGSFVPLVAIGLIFVIFYVFIIGPQKKEQKKTQEMIAGAQKGDKIVTIGGIHGTISSTKEQPVIVKVDENTKIEFSRSAIASVITDKAETASGTASEEKGEKKSLFGKTKKDNKKAEETSSEK